MKKINDTNYSKFAAKAGISLSHLSNIMSGKAKPSIKLAMKLEKESYGVIKAIRLRPEIKAIIKEYL